MLADELLPAVQKKRTARLIVIPFLSRSHDVLALMYGLDARNNGDCIKDFELNRAEQE